jgi:hypothetical protein
MERLLLTRRGDSWMVIRANRRRGNIFQRKGAMLETCGSAGKGRDVKEGCTFPVTES